MATSASELLNDINEVLEAVREGTVRRWKGCESGLERLRAKLQAAELQSRRFADVDITAIVGKDQELILAAGMLSIHRIRRMCESALKVYGKLATVGRLLTEDELKFMDDLRHIIERELPKLGSHPHQRFRIDEQEEDDGGAMRDRFAY